MEDKINRFIGMLSKRNDKTLNEFFYEIAISFQDLINKSSISDEDRGLMDFEAAKLRYENEKLSRMMKLFCIESPLDITDQELRELERFSHGKYYTAKSFFDTINKIRSVKSMMQFFYPERTNFANTMQELTQGETVLNEKLCNLK